MVYMQWKRIIITKYLTLDSALMPPIEARRQVTAAQSLKARCLLQTATPHCAWQYSVLVLKLLQLSVSTLRMILPKAKNVNRFLIYPVASLSAAADYFPALQSFIVFIHMHRTCSHALLHRAAH